MQLDSTLSATVQPFQPWAAPQSSREDDVPRTYPVRHGLAGNSPTLGFAADSPVGRAFPSHRQSLMMTGYPRIHPSPIGPPEGGVEAEEAKVARVVVTLMEPTPLGEEM